VNTEVSEQKDWTQIDYQPAIPDHPPVPVLQHVPPGSTVLDIGCNKGSNAIFLAGHGFRVLGIDINGAAIEVARMRAQELSAPGSAQFRVADVLEEPVTDHFNVVLLIRVLTCFAESSEWDALLRRATQLLKSRGYIYIHDFLTSPDNEAYRMRYKAGARLGWRTGNFQVNDARGNRLFIAHHHSPAEVASIRAGFENLSYRSHDSLSMNRNACRMFEFLGQRRT
jgi:cyclopropane fatty-acyl-phospholipid synthase-like methyltransferase